MVAILGQQQSASNTQEADEGWWASILADEEKIYQENKEFNCQPCDSKSNKAVDWECVRTIYERDQVILMEVTGFNRGGLLVQNNGIQGFVPISHLVNLPTEVMEEERQHELADYVGKSIYVKIIECDEESDRIVLSERAAQAGEGKRKELFEHLKPGVVVCGVVTNITDFGAFIDLGGVEGLVHVSEMSWGRVDSPENLLHMGERVKVIVLQVNESNSRIALSIKRLTPNPWDKMMRIYKPGDIVHAKLTSITRFGIFARLEEGIEGLIHMSSFPENLRSRDLDKQFAPGQNVQVKILHIDIDRRRLGLGLITQE
jgi:small subunit ribosomal protein S1